MGVFARLAGVGMSVTHEDVAYRMGPITPTIKGLFEDWMQRRAWLNLNRQEKLVKEGLVSAERFAVLQQEHNANLLADGYSWGTPSYQTILNTTAGREYLTFLCLKANHQEATEEFAAVLWQDIPDQMLFTLKSLLTVPNSPTPAPGPASGNGKSGEPASTLCGSGLGSSMGQP